MDPEKKRLEDLNLIVHGAVRMLKIGQTGTIPVGKDYKLEEILQYVQAYAMHKGKWFETKYDATSKVIFASRVVVPTWKGPGIEEEPDEP